MSQAVGVPTGSGRQGCHHRRSGGRPATPARYLRFRSARRSGGGVRRAMGARRCRGAWAGGLDGVTRAAAQRGDAQRRAGYRGTTAQWHAERAARRRTGEARDASGAEGVCAGATVGCRDRSDGAAVSGPVVPWKGRRHGPRQPRRWARAWSRSRSRGGCGSTFLAMVRCGSAMRRSTRRSTFRAAARCVAS